jgi:outer membrane protein assembly factor BamB
VYIPPAVVGNELFIGSCAGRVYALDKRSGRTLWSYDTRQDGGPFSFHGTPFVASRTIVVGADNGHFGDVYAFDLSNGKLLWKNRVRDGGIPTDITGWGSEVYTVASRDRLACRDLRTGAVRWRFQTKYSGRWWWSEPPAVTADRVFFGGLDGTLYAFDAKSGRIVWNRQIGARISTSVIALGKSLYFGTADGHIYRLSASDGQILAGLKVEPAPVSAPAVTKTSLLYFLYSGGGPGGKGESLVCLDRSLKTVRWRHDSADWDTNRPYAWHGLVLVGGTNGEVTAFRVGDGLRQWSYTLGGVIRSISGDYQSLYVGALHGMVYAFRP